MVKLLIHHGACHGASAVPRTGSWVVGPFTAAVDVRSFSPPWCVWEPRALPSCACVGANVNMVRAGRHGPDGETALHIAARQGFADIAVDLIGAGADPTLLSGGKNALHIGASAGFVSFCQWLVTRCAMDLVRAVQGRDGGGGRNFGVSWGATVSH